MFSFYCLALWLCTGIDDWFSLGPLWKNIIGFFNELELFLVIASHNYNCFILVGKSNAE